MNRLQKKCLIATAGTHLLLIVALLCSGFVTSKPKPDETPAVEVIPANVIEAAFSSGVKNAPKPPSKPPEIKPPEPQVQPKPEPVKPAPKPEPKPEVKPDPEPVKSEKPDPDLTPVVKPKPPKHEIKIEAVN